MSLRKFSALCVLLVAGFGAAAAASAQQVSLRSVKGEFDDVKERMVLAIENHGLVINYTAYVGNMLERTGKDIGHEQRIYGKAEVLEFCSAGVSRATMEADPRNIAYCPYTIAVYTLPHEAQKVYIAYRKPPQSTQPLREIGRLLDSIVREALK